MTKRIKSSLDTSRTMPTSRTEGSISLQDDRSISEETANTRPSGNLTTLSQPSEPASKNLEPAGKSESGRLSVMRDSVSMRDEDTSGKSNAAKGDAG